MQLRSLDDPALMGFQMSPGTQELWDAPPPEYLEWPWRAKFVLVCKRYPMHFVMHTVYTLPVLAATITPVLLAGFHSRAMIDALPEYSGSWCARALERP